MEAATAQMQAATVTRGRAGVGSYLLAIFLPIGGVIAAIVQFARGHVGPGIAVLLTSVVAFAVWTTILFSVAVGGAVNDYDACINDARTLNQQLKC